MATGVLFAGAPVLTELQPRGAQKGRPFVLTVAGRDLGEGARVWSTMPASFTPVSPEKSGPMTEGRYASFLVEPKESLAPGVYPIRIESPDGISNILLFTVGTFAELTEDESRPGGLPNSNDSIESAQPMQSTPITMNGTLRGPERDVYRVSGKAGEKRVFEVEARRCGSAVDPVLRVLDSAGKVLARSEDSPMIGLDARVEVTFPREGFYYVEVRDARYSTQAANFYRLKSGFYPYAEEVFPLGGRRGGTVEVAMGARKVNVDLRQASGKQMFVNLPDSGSLPLPFAVGDHPEAVEPVADALAIPVTVNGRLSKPGESDTYRYRVTAGETLAFRVEARDLGTSKLMAVLSAACENGKALARAGDEPLPDDFYNVNQSRTVGDPMLRVLVPEGCATLTLSVEDLALRGGPGYPYRITAERVSQDFRITLNAPFVNIPAGGSAAVPVTVERRGFETEVQLRVANLPPGIKAEGGFVVAGAPVKERAGNRSSRGVLILTAEPGASLAPTELTVEADVALPDGTKLTRRAEGPGMAVAVAGATQQGSVDRQRAITAPWLGLQLPAATTKPQPATLEVAYTGRKRMDEGDQIQFRWKWTPRDPMLALPKQVTAEMVGAGDVRVIDAQVDPKDRTAGTFVMTTTKLTRPSKYDVYVTGRLTIDGQTEEIVSRPVTVEVEEVKTPDVVTTASSR